VLIAVVAAIAAGGCFAAGGVLQQHAASSRPVHESLTVRLLVNLARDRLWLLGIGCAFLSYAFESLALAYGPLVLVQPLIVTELLFALPISIRWRGMRMSGREWTGTISVSCGLTLGLLCASPGQGRPEAPLGEWGIGLGVAVVLTLGAVVAGRRANGPLQSSLYAVGAAIAFGTQAALLKAVIAQFEHGPVTALADWQVWAMVIASLVGLLLVQSAYASGPLAASMPVVDAVGPLVATCCGIALFHEQVRTGAWLVGIGGGVLLLLVGIAVLDTSPLVVSLLQLERRQRGEPSAGRPEQPPAGQRERPEQPGAGQPMQPDVSEQPAGVAGS
jgi:drug/metabolite transporter (DMT)-like permease